MPISLLGKNFHFNLLALSSSLRQIIFASYNRNIFVTAKIYRR